MRRADRLFQIVALLGRRRFMTAAQLAEALEVSTRTIYRDVLDLIASGVRISGEAGVGYQLDPSYRLPPLTFTAEELEALILGVRMVEAWGDTSLRQGARAVQEKVSGVLEESDRGLLQNTALFALRFGVQEQASEHLGIVRRAVNERRLLTFGYVDESGAASERSVRSLGLYFWGRAWTLAAFCDLREDFRTFRVDRMRDPRLTSETFELVSPCTLEDYAKAMEARVFRERTETPRSG
jgi:predicted DNA-binding transcriptional regulator YafY